MIRKILKPTDTNLVINIPQEYVGKEIEYIIFPIKEHNKPNKKSKKDISSLKGILNKYANPSKIELEKSAWKNSIKKKFKIDA